jgi:hypothetical protein
MLKLQNSVCETLHHLPSDASSVISQRSPMTPRRVTSHDMSVILKASSVSGGDYRAACLRSVIRASVPIALIRDLRAEVHANLQRRAEEAGQSLQQYLTNELSRISHSPTITGDRRRPCPPTARSHGRTGLPYRKAWGIRWPAISRVSRVSQTRSASVPASRFRFAETK